MEELKTYTLTRDGMKDLRFKGEVLAEVSDHHYQGPRNTRWTVIKVYRTEAGAYVVGVVHRTLWENEADRYHAVVCEKPADVYQAMQDHFPDYLPDLAKEALCEADLAEQTIEVLA